MHHPDLSRISLSAATQDTRQVFAVLESITGRPVREYRPPHGHLTFRTALMLRRMGAKTWLWDVNSGDWRPDATVESILDRSMQATTGGIILMHDASERTVEATRLLLEHLSALRMEIVPL